LSHIRSLLQVPQAARGAAVHGVDHEVVVAVARCLLAQTGKPKRLEAFNSSRQVLTVQGAAEKEAPSK